MTFIRLAVALGLVLLLGTAASAETGAVLKADTVAVPLTAHLEVLADAESQLTVEQVADPSRANTFTPVGQASVNGYTEAALWYRLTVSRTADAPETWALRLMPAYLNDIRVYQPDGQGGFSETRTGDHVPHAGRAIPLRGHAIPLTLPETTPRTLYIRVKTNSSSVLTATVGSPERLLEAEATQALMLGAFFGCLAIVALLHAAVGLWLGDRATLCYAAYVASLVFLHANVNGIVSRYVDPAAPWVVDVLTGGSVLLSTAAVAFMWDRLLNCRLRFPRAHMAFMAVCVFCLLAIPTAAGSLYPLTATIANLMAAMSMTLGVVLAATLLWRREKEPGLTLYFVGFLVSWAGLVLYLAGLSGLLPITPLTAYGFQASSLFHVILLALGLSLRLRDMERTKTLAERDSAAFRAQVAAQRRFVQMLSHEFRAPLASISQAAQMVQLYCEDLDEPAQARLARIRARAARLSGLVDVFLARETLATATLQATLGPIRADVLVAAAVDRAGGRSDRVLTSIAPPDLVLEADEILLPVALGNLVENALKYSVPESPVGITVTRDGGGNAITVENTGQGLTAEDAARADAPHYRGAASTGHDGSGLGLHIARQIMAAHGGHLAWRSTGTTTTVTLVLPPS